MKIKQVEASPQVRYRYQLLNRYYRLQHKLDHMHIGDLENIYFTIEQIDNIKAKIFKLVVDNH